MNLYGMKDYKRVRETHLDHKPNGNGYRFREENEEDNPFKNYTMEDYEVYCNKMELGYYSGSMII